MNHINKTDFSRTIIFKAILNGNFAPDDKLPPERNMTERAGLRLRRGDYFYVSSQIQRCAMTTP